MVKIINIDTTTRTIRVENADSDIKTWRTTESGVHFPIKKGESTKEALDKFVGSKRPEAKTPYPSAEAVAKYKKDGNKDPNEFIKKAAEHNRKYEEAKEKLAAVVGRSADQQIHDLNKEYSAIVDRMPQGKEKTAKIKEWVDKYHAIQDSVIDMAEQQSVKWRKSGLLGDKYDAEHGTQPEKSNAPLLGDREVKDVTDWPKSPKFEKLTEQYMPKQAKEKLVKKEFDKESEDKLHRGTISEEEYEPWEKEKREKKEPTRAGDIVKIKYSDGSFGVGKVNCFTTHDDEIGCEVEADQGRLRFYPKKQLEALKYVPKSEITDGWTNDSYYNGIKGEHMRAELYKDPAVKEAAHKRVERSQRVEAETGVSPEDWEAYESVRESGASNMYDYAYINATTGLPRETIRKIQENYEKLQEAYGQD